MRRTFFLTTAAFVICLSGGFFPAGAQEPPAEGASEGSAREVRRFELGAHYSSADFDGISRSPGVGGRVTYNLTRHLALEAEVNLFPYKATGPEYVTGGRTSQGQFGVKAGRRFGRVGLFAKVRPGFVSFSETVTPHVAGSFVGVGGREFFLVDFVTERKTHLSLDVGGAAEFYHTPRLFTRVDFGDTVVRYGRHRELTGDPTDPILEAPARHDHKLQFSVGVGVRLGPRAGGEGSADYDDGGDGDADPLPRFELGAHFTSLSFSPIRQLTRDVIVSAPGPTRTEFGFGGRFTFNITRHFALEAEQNLLPREFALAVGASGRLWQGQFGLKVGGRSRRFGLFAKARPGFVSFGRSLTLVGTETITVLGIPRVFGTFEFRRRTFFSADVGGVFEIYPSRRWLVRFDVGDTVIAYRARHLEGLSLSQLIQTTPAETRHNLQFTSGVAFRF